MKTDLKDRDQLNEPQDLVNGSPENPAYLQLAETLKEQILDGVYQCGDKIPSEAALGKKYGLALMTARRAVGVLAEQGLLERRPGRGTFVKELSWAGAPFYIDGLVERLRGRANKVRIIKSEVRRATREVAAALGLSLGDSVIFLKRQIEGPEGAFLLQEGYLVLDPHRPVVEAELEATYLTGLFVGQGQGLIKRASLSLTPLALTAESAQALERPPGSVGFRLEYTFYDAELRPLAQGFFIAPESTLKLKAQIGIHQAGRARPENGPA